MKIRTVLDTNQIATAGSELLERHPEKPVHAFVCKVLKKHTGLYSQEIAKEYCATLSRKYPTSAGLVRYLGTIIKLSKKVQIVSKECSPPPKDLASVKFLLCALDGKADMLVTDKNDLLEIRGGYQHPTICRREEAEPRVGS